MEERNNRFPERESWIRNRAGEIGSGASSVPRSVQRPLRLHRIFGPLLILGVAAVLYYFDRPGESVSPPRAPDPVLSTRPERTTPSVPQPVLASAHEVDTAPPAIIPEPETGVQDARVPIGIGFRPIGFRIPARSGRLPLTQNIPPGLHALPLRQGSEQRYGMLELRDGRRYPFLLDGVSGGYLLYLDRNRNGDLRDDGPPIKNRGPGRFAGRIELPLAPLSGVAELSGDYVLWLFSSPRGWEEGWLSYYCMTQLSGELLLGGRRYTAYLADNLVIDGDYRNDGIYIDLDGNGRIDEATEFFPPGSPVGVNGGRYRFQVTY